jgi:hypothetical protein
MRRRTPIAVSLTVPVLAAALAACGTAGTGSEAAVTTTATTTTTATATATATATTTVTATPTSSDPALAARLAALACESYVYAGTVSAADSSGPLDEAGSTGTSAAVVDPSWTDLAGALAFMAALPLTDNTPADVDRASKEVALIKTRCGDAGVKVS